MTKNKSEQCGGALANYTLDTSKHIGGMPVVHGFDLTEFNNSTFSGGSLSKTKKTKLNKRSKKTKLNKRSKKTKLNKRSKKTKLNKRSKKSKKTKKNMWGIFGLKGGMASKYPFTGEQGNFGMDNIEFTGGQHTWNVNTR
jgi:hypothetical protein